MSVRLKRLVYCIVCLCPFFFIALAHSQSQAVEVIIDTTKTHAPISKYIYGQFVEHIGDIVNDGIWAEMLDDRKFYHPILAKEPEQPAPTNRWRPEPRRWISIGSLKRIAMDAENVFTGEHSPRITVNSGGKRGIRQNGLALKKDKNYMGRIVLAADQDIGVKVELVWGDEAADRDTEIIAVSPGSYETYDLNFQAGRDVTDARLEITGQGKKGSLWIGAVSLMPADNVSGFRKEVVTLLKSLNSGVYRFPGGNFVSAHEWRDAIGDRDLRPPIMDPVWDAVQPNDVGTDEFMTLCRLLDVEPYITVNAGFGDAWSAAQLVEYANGSIETPMGKLRAENGHPEPYNVKFWGVGNEAWGSWQMGAMALNQFVHKHNQFAKAMRKVDPSIKLIGSGAMPDSMTCSDETRKRTGKIVTEYLGPADWTGGLFQHCLANMDMISEHYYANGSKRFDMATGEKVELDPNEPLVDWMRRPANHIKVKVEAYNDYLELIPELRKKRIPIVVAEWAYIHSSPHSYKVVPAYAWVFHEMFRNSELFQMANYTFATSLLSMNNTDAVLNPSGLLFKLYRDHFGTIPVTVSGKAPQSRPLYESGGQDPKINAGSPTFPLDVSAAFTEDRKALTVAVINPTETEQTLHFSFKGIDPNNKGMLWRMAPDNIDAQNIVGNKAEVEVEQEDISRIPDRTLVKPYSVSIYRININ